MSLIYPTEKEANGNIKAVLFDLDGTLLDTYGVILESMQYAMREVLGKEFSPEVLMGKVGTPLAAQMMDFAQGNEAVRDELLNAYFDRNAVIHDDRVKPFEGVETALQCLQASGYPMGVVTSKRHNPAMHGLSLFGLDAYMHFVIGADDCDSHKPEPGPIIYGAEMLGLDSRECLYVGDSPYDIQAGNAAGATTVAALWGMFSEAVLLAEKPDRLFKTIGELPLFLEAPVSAYKG